MRRRLDLAMTLVGDPRIIFLDEPTTGLDPRSRRTMWQIIRDLVAGGVTDLPHHAVPGGGRPARRPDRGARPRPDRRRGHPGELKRRIPGGHIRLRFADPRELESAAHVLGGASRDDEALTLQVPSDGGVASLRALLDRLDDASVEVGELSIHTPDLDDVFFALTGNPSTEKEAQR